MQVQQPKYQGLVADLLPNIRLMQAFGHFIFRYVSGPILIRKIYSCAHLFLLLFNFACILVNLAATTNEVSELTCKLKQSIFSFLLCKLNFHRRKFFPQQTQ
jgi:odorant receptor